MAPGDGSLFRWQAIHPTDRIGVNYRKEISFEMSDKVHIHMDVDYSDVMERHGALREIFKSGHPEKVLHELLSQWYVNRSNDFILNYVREHPEHAKSDVVVSYDHYMDKKIPVNVYSTVEPTDSTFTQIREEYTRSPIPKNNLTFFVLLSLNEMFKVDDRYTIQAGTNCGLFDEYTGGSSLLCMKTRVQKMVPVTKILPDCCGKFSVPSMYPRTLWK